MKEVRLGIVGTGGMGTGHARNILAGKIPRLRLAAVCDIVPQKMESFPADVKRFNTSAELIASGDVDAVLVATPTMPTPRWASSPPGRQAPAG